MESLLTGGPISNEELIMVLENPSWPAPFLGMSGVSRMQYIMFSIHERMKRKSHLLKKLN